MWHAPHQALLFFVLTHCCDLGSSKLVTCKLPSLKCPPQPHLFLLMHDPLDNSEPLGQLTCQV